MPPLDTLEAWILNLQWAMPWALLMLPLPLLMRQLPPYREAQNAVRVPFFERLLEASEARRERGAMTPRRLRS